MTSLECKAAFKSAVTLKKLSAAEAIRRFFGVSYNHAMLVIDGRRIGSRRLRDAIAAFLDRPEPEVFGPEPASTVGSDPPSSRH